MNGKVNATGKKPIRKVRAVMGTGLTLTGFAGVIIWLANAYGLEIPGEVAMFLAAALVSAGTSAAGYFARADERDVVVVNPPSPEVQPPPQEDEDAA